ncbi:MAG: MBL fold metallo-hydrolase [Candidatus Azambacteria bacterium]|nr:MBL fold metallo-hydrolase [Candidatus Azambacteria bacterium]
MNKRYYFFFLIFTAASVWAFAVAGAPRDFLSVYALDVGQGDATFIETPRRHQILIDGGPDTRVVSELAEVMSFWDRSIDLIVLTHPQEDHMFGFIEVLRRYDVANVLMTGVNYHTRTYEEFKKAIEKEGARVILARAGEKIKFDDGVEMDILFPTNTIAGTDAPADVNDTSVASRLRFGERTFLFMGDAGIQEESALVYSGEDIDIDVLKVNHHGSRTSTSLLFLEKTTPTLALVSVGAKNKYGHPHQDTLTRLAEVPIYRTDTQGRVAVYTDGVHISVATER